MIIIVSYRSEYELFCGRSCHCRHGSNGSDFEIHTVRDEEEAATWLARRLSEDEHSEYVNIVFDRWEHALYAGKYANSWSPTKGTGSIHVQSAAPDYDNEGWEAGVEEEKRAGEMSARLHELTAPKLEAAWKAKEDAEDEKEEKERAAVLEARKKQDLAELQRLKAAYEPKT